MNSRPSETLRLHALPLCALVPLACASARWSGVVRSEADLIRPLGTVSVADRLAASAEDPTAEVRGFLELRGAAEAPGDRRGSDFGVRLGLVAFGASDWGSDLVRPIGGLYLRSGGSRKAFLDANLDFAKEEDAAAASNATYFRAYVGLGGRLTGAARQVDSTGEAGRAAGPVFYVAYGLGVAYELTELSAWDRTVDRFALAGRLGLGLAPPTGPWEVQLTYSVFVGESDLRDEALLAVAVGF